MIICLAVQISREVVLLAEEPPLWKSGTTSLEKWRSLRKKVSLTPKKGNEVPKKSLSPIPSENVLFAKKRIKIGKIWPLQLHFWSTHAYRGSPPYAIFPIPDSKKYSIVLCYQIPTLAPFSVICFLEWGFSDTWHIKLHMISVVLTMWVFVLIIRYVYIQIEV